MKAIGKTTHGQFTIGMGQFLTGAAALVSSGSLCWPPRWSDLFYRHWLSQQAFMAQGTARALQYLLSGGSAGVAVLDYGWDLR
jgi:hypothetical protein